MILPQKSNFPHSNVACFMKWQSLNKVINKTACMLIVVVLTIMVAKTKYGELIGPPGRFMLTQ